MEEGYVMEEGICDGSTPRCGYVIGQGGHTDLQPQTSRDNRVLFQG